MTAASAACTELQYMTRSFSITRTVFTTAACAFWAMHTSAQVLINTELIEEHNTNWLRSHRYPDADNGVRVVRFTYWTTGLNGNPTKASGVLVDPVTDCSTPLLCYIHGTSFRKKDVASYWEENTGAASGSFPYATQGIATVLPDLLGLGESPGLHPYLHAASEASACMDAVRAAREYRTQRGQPLNDQLFLAGSSAGSHAALATAQAMQNEHPEEFQVTAVAGINGPYAIYPVMRDAFTSGQHNAGMANLASVLMAYNQAYPDLFGATSEFMQAPYSSQVPPLFDGEHTREQIDNKLPNNADDLLPTALRNSLENQPNGPLNQRLKENTVFNWKPEFPVKLCYCNSDEFVSPQNSILAASTFEANGATQVTTYMPSNTAGHGQCGQLSDPVVLAWILSMKSSCAVQVEDLHAEQPDFTLVPNPVSSGMLTLLFGGQRPGSTVPVTITDLSGRTVFAAELPNLDGRVELSTDGLRNGTYFVSAGSFGTAQREKLVVLR